MIFQNLKEKGEYYRGLTDYRLLPNTNVLVMCDGRAFSKLIKNHFGKPFDMDFVNMMNETAKYVCENVQGVKIAFVQSDEISFLLKDEGEATPFFSNRMCKILSIIASLATAKFNQLAILYEIKSRDYDTFKIDCIDTIYKINEATNLIENQKLAQFDCKCWNVPSDNDAFAWFKYRQLDCIKNSKQQAAQTYLSHKELLNLNADEQIAKMKEEKGIDWNCYKNGLKYGRIIHRVEQEHEVTIKPNKKYPDGATIMVKRNAWVATDATPLEKEEFFKLMTTNTENGKKEN